MTFAIRPGNSTFMHPNYTLLDFPPPFLMTTGKLALVLVLLAGFFVLIVWLSRRLSAHPSTIPHPEDRARAVAAAAARHLHNPTSSEDT